MFDGNIHTERRIAKKRNSGPSVSQFLEQTRKQVRFLTLILTSHGDPA